MANGYRFELNRANVENLMHNTEGPVIGKFLKTRGAVALLAAKMQVGRKTGALGRSIKMTHTRTAIGQTLTISASSPIAFYHHEGTRPHLITARDGGFLKFSGKGGVTYARTVRHPGTKPNRFLSDQLKFFRR
jgi:hypothetical protein